MGGQPVFEDLLRGWMSAAAAEWSYPSPTDSQVGRILDRIPPGVRQLVETGISQSLIVPVGTYRFTLRGLPTGKGPYAWLSKYTATQVPSMNWEYLAQAAEFARIYSVLAGSGCIVAVEDRLMDITVSREGRLLWYVEVKEKAADVEVFITEIRRHGAAGVDLDEPDRHRDALRKAKYLVLYRPEYFTVSAIGVRRDFLVGGEGNRFTLTEDMVPLG